jgi:hypothetical protein
MRFFRILSTGIILAAFFCSGVQKAELVAGFEKQKGISYACWWPGLYSLPESDASLAHLMETGANWISLIVTCYQDNIGSTRISANESTPTDADLISVLEKAHALGLKVLLKPHLDLWDDPSHWRGQIGLSFKTETEWAEWFASYRSFIEHYADLATSHGADQFCVGCELESTTHREGDWRRVVAGVRSRYSGPLLYAGNHSGEEARIAWWDAVDVIGVDAYYSLANKNNPSLAELKAAWTPKVAALASLAAKWQKLIILTEIGYRSLDGAASHPWDWQISGKVDLQEQADCYLAVFESLYNEPWLSGIFWWSWGPDPFEGGPEDSGYTPHDKPAEDVLRAWYGGQPRRSRRAELEPDPSRSMEIVSDGLDEGWQDWSWGAEHDLSAFDQVHNGKYSLRAKLGPSGALSFWHEVFFSYPYFYLEFSIRASTQDETQLWVYFHDRTGAPLLRVPIDDSRFVQGGALATDKWMRVLVPLTAMNAFRIPLCRLTLQDRSGFGTETFWIDDLRLIGARLQKKEPKPGKS